MTPSVIDDVMKCVQSLRAEKRFGPYVVYLPWTRRRRPFKPGHQGTLFGRVENKTSIREEVLKLLTEISGTSTQVTAWYVAKRINAQGSSVSSVMYKMAQRGEIIRWPKEHPSARTKHGGWWYSMPRG